MKNYIKPTAEIVQVECTSVMVTDSTRIKIDTTTEGSEQLSNKNSGAWGKLWNSK